MINFEVAAENGILENIQVVVLFIATLVFAARCYALYKKDAFVLLPYGLFVTIMPFVGVFRELTFGATLGASAQGMLIVQVIMGVIAGLVLATALFIFFRFVDRKAAAIWRYLSHPTSVHIYLAILVFGVSSLFERGGFHMPESVLLEEAVELLAFLIMLRGAWVLR